MKRPSPILRAGTGLLVSAVLATCAACDTATPPVSTPPVQILPSETASPSPSPESSSEAALRAYYESLIADLKQALLDEKQADYITQRDYEARISELEAKLNALQNSADPPTLGTDLPVSSLPDPSPADTEAPTSSRPATTAFQYTVESGNAVITSYRGTSLHVTIPSSIAGFPVTRIEDNAFRATPIVSVTVPDSLTEIGWFAFADCPNLASATLPATLQAIDYGAFDNCPTLIVHCPKGSYAEKYALSFALRIAGND